jgi:hypothetical protein
VSQNNSRATIDETTKFSFYAHGGLMHQKYIQDNESREKVENMIESVTQKISKKWPQIGIEKGKL